MARPPAGSAPCRRRAFLTRDDRREAEARAPWAVPRDEAALHQRQYLATSAGRLRAPRVDPFLEARPRRVREHGDHRDHRARRATFQIRWKRMPSTAMLPHVGVGGVPGPSPAPRGMLRRGSRRAASRTTTTRPSVFGEGGAGGCGCAAPIEVRRPHVVCLAQHRHAPAHEPRGRHPADDREREAAQIVIARWSSVTRITMLIGSRGNASNPSTARIRTASTQPPSSPATAPSERTRARG